MYIKNIMITDVITIEQTASLSAAFQKMMENGYSQLPVVEDGELIGLITNKVLSEFTPSKATTLSIYEMNYILGKTKCTDIMLEDIITTSPDALVEDAAIVLTENNISSLPVVDENNQLLGIITDDDILSAFIEIVGRNDKGSRIALEAKNQVGILADIAVTITSYNMNITHVIDYSSKCSDYSSEIIIRVDSLEPEALIKELEQKGYKVNSVIKNK
jgi:acetoin utilization protein AcuB